ncbi:Apolipoprotein N-acyltransferase [Nocardioides dokdonensis FR1436]|uniref:Apolipoprotein N-acyltransferase n=1 Tax=Nocardioides dokdonensis FR1436 TaxID=1300347 RepID=A0A1A9GPX0_9ACTN|nr:apolipoprotein N-acyltransferase [Nocardioides dokdonensis]ANH39702.1 Apolipoprotein N-acyltransferase [Nocardioides dokdonensis FR1436]
MLQRSVLALLAGVALAMAYEPFAIPALVPLLVPGGVAAHTLLTRGLGLRRAFVVGLAFGVGFYYVHIYWMTTVAMAAWLGLSFLEALFYGILGSAVALLTRLPVWPLWVATAWVSMEVWRSGWPFSGMPWGRLGFSVVDTPVAAALPYVGMAGVTFLLALAGAALAAVLVGQGRTRLVALATLGVVVASVALAVALPWTTRTDGAVTVAVVQGDVPGPGNDILYDYRQVTENHAQATVDLADDVAAGRVPAPDFVLWPENSTAVDPFRDGETQAQIRRATEAIGVPVLVGAIVDGGPGAVLNQGIVWDPVTGAGERYTKRHPVAYGEYIPFRSVADFNFGELARIGRDMLAGTGRDPLSIGGAEVADAICFDVAYEDAIHDQVTRGAQLLSVQTSNATFIFSDQILQQFAMTRLRAIETGRATVVASTNGVSGVIGPDGEVVATAGVRETEVLVEEVELRSGLTPAVRLARWPWQVAVTLTLIALVAALLPYRRARRDRAEQARTPAQGAGGAEEPRRGAETMAEQP